MNLKTAFDTEDAEKSEEDTEACEASGPHPKVEQTFFSVSSMSLCALCRKRQATAFWIIGSLADTHDITT